MEVQNVIDHYEYVLHQLNGQIQKLLSEKQELE